MFNKGKCSGLGRKENLLPDQGAQRKLHEAKP